MGKYTMKLGVLTASASRKAGGLFWAINSLTSALKFHISDIHVFAGMDEFSMEDRKVWGNVNLGLFEKFGPSAFGYQVGLKQALVESQIDLVHVHGLWMYPSVVAKSWGRRHGPYLISPHGMLDPWAIHNAVWKKRFATLFYERAHLNNAFCIHALCDSEYSSIRSFGLRNPIAVIPNGVVLPDLDRSLPDPEWASRIDPKAKIIFFLGRLHPKKGLVNLLYAWALAKGDESSAKDPWHLVIAGWDQGEHKAELQRLVNELGIDATVHFVGPQFDIAKTASLRRADAFILPSYSEGLPVAVLEAWSYGLPVIMTSQCNIPEGFINDAALEIKPEINSIRQGLNEFFSLTDNELLLMGECGRKLVEEKFTWKKIANDMFNVYRWVLGGGVAPDCMRLD